MKNPMKGALRLKKDTGKQTSAGAKYLSIFGCLLMAYAFVYFVMESSDSASEKDKDKAVIAVSPVRDEPLTTVISEEAALSSAMLESIQSLAPAELEVSIDEQTRLDAIIKAFQRLPGKELDRFNVNFDAPIVAGTPEAEHLLESWAARQKELKEAMKNILQPAEHMTNITRMLNGTAPELQPAYITLTAADGSTTTAADTATEAIQLSVDDKVYLLQQLESLLDDVDNARDFHTIGAWPTLLAFLQPHMQIRLRTAAAWAVGTAVKNTYDYQLWTLETAPVLPDVDVFVGSAVSGAGAVTVGAVSSTSGDTVAEETVPAAGKSAVQLLVDMLVADNFLPDVSLPEGTDGVSAVHDLQKRALYALSSATRGNLDVQDHTMRVTDGHMQSVYLDNLLNLAGKYTATPAELQRKVWATVSDLIEERVYIRKELQTEAAALLAKHSANAGAGVNVNNTDGSSGVAEELAAVEAVQHTILLGDFLLSEHWLAVATYAGLHCTYLLSSHAAMAASAGTVSTDCGGLNANGVTSDSDMVSIHASLRSILTYFTEVLQDKPEIYSAVPSNTSGWQSTLHNVVRTLREAHFDVPQYEALRESAEALAALIGLLD